MYILNGPDIQAPGGLDKDHQITPKLNLPCDNGLLLISSAHGPDNGVIPLAASDIVLLNKPLAIGGKLALLDNPLSGKGLLEVILQGQVV